MIELVCRILAFKISKLRARFEALTGHYETVAAVLVVACVPSPMQAAAIRGVTFCCISHWYVEAIALWVSGALGLALCPSKSRAQTFTRHHGTILGVVIATPAEPS